MVPVNNLPDVIAKAGEALERINALLSDENFDSISDSLPNAKRATAELPAAVAENQGSVERFAGQGLAEFE